MEADHPKQLAESIELFLEQPCDRFVRRVARADAGAAGGDDHLRRLIGQLPANDGSHLRGLVFDDGVTGHRVAGMFE